MGRFQDLQVAFSILLLDEHQFQHLFFGSASGIFTKSCCLSSCPFFVAPFGGN
jgi:hypothetical protein